MKSQSGNILFLILIAVALFAALSYAVTSSSRSGGSNLREKAQVSSASIINFATSMKAATDRLRLSNGCTDTTISFENPVVTTNFNYVNASASQKCFVFHPEGGGLSWPADSLVNGLPKSMIIAGSNQVKDVGTNCPTSPYSPCNELVLLLIDLSKEKCMEINAKLGIEQSGQDTPEIPDINAGSGFTGTYGNTARWFGNVSTDSSLAGQMSGCFRETTTQSYAAYTSTSQTPYIFYQVLMAR